MDYFNKKTLSCPVENGQINGHLKGDLWTTINSAVELKNESNKAINVSKISRCVQCNLFRKIEWAHLSKITKFSVFLNF